MGNECSSNPLCGVIREADWSSVAFIERPNSSKSVCLSLPLTACGEGEGAGLAHLAAQARGLKVNLFFLARFSDPRLSSALNRHPSLPHTQDPCQP